MGGTTLPTVGVPDLWVSPGNRGAQLHSTGFLLFPGFLVQPLPCFFCSGTEATFVFHPEEVIFSPVACLGTILLRSDRFLSTCTAGVLSRTGSGGSGLSRKKPPSTDTFGKQRLNAFQRRILRGWKRLLDALRQYLCCFTRSGCLDAAEFRGCHAVSSLDRRGWQNGWVVLPPLCFPRGWLGAYMFLKVAVSASP